MERLVVGIGQLATLAGPPRARRGPEMADLGLVSGAAILVRDGKVAAAGREEAVRAAASAEAVETDVGGRLVTPGLVDAHTHLAFGGNRAEEFAMRIAGATYQEIAAGGGGIASTVRQTRALGEDALYEAAAARLQRMHRHGTTTVEAKSGYGLSLSEELKILRVYRRLGARVSPTFLGAHAFPPEFASDHEGYVRLVVEEMLPAVVAEGLAAWCDIFVEERYFGAEAARRILGAAKGLGLKVRMHVDQLSNGGGAALAAELGAKTADHLEQTDGDGIAALLAGDVMPVLLPGSVYALGLDRYPRAREMVDAGLPVVLATDFNPGSSPMPSLPMAMSLACVQMKLTPAEALTACTVNAAHSLDRGDHIGSIEPGKDADFVVWDAGDYRELPYWFGGNLVAQTWMAGELLT